MDTYQFKYQLNQLIALQEDYNLLKDKYRKLLNKSDFDDALKTLVPIKLKLIDMHNHLFVCCLYTKLWFAGLFRKPLQKQRNKYLFLMFQKPH